MVSGERIRYLYASTVFNAMKKPFIFLAAVLALATPAAFAAGDCPLCAAADSGDSTEIRRMLSEGINPNMPGANPDAKVKDGWTALMSAARKNHAEVVATLLEAGADIDAANDDGETALIWAAFEGNSDIVKMLLDAGVDIDAKTERRNIYSAGDGFTALMWAVFEGHSDIVKILLDSGADVEAETRHGITALYLALVSDADIAIMLIDAGANLDMSYVIGALLGGHTEILLQVVKLWWEKE